MKKSGPSVTAKREKPRLGRLDRRVFYVACCAGIVLLLAAVVFALLPKAQADLPPAGAALQTAAKGLGEVEIIAEFFPEERKLRAVQTLRVQNKTGEVRKDIVLRTYANAFSAQEYSPAAIEDTFDACYLKGFSPGGIAFSSVMLDGKDAGHSYDDAAKTVLNIGIPAGWEREGWITVSLAYEITIPECAYRFGYASDIYTLGNVFPIVSVWENGSWRKEEYFPLGDPFISECANYHVKLTVPQGYLCAGSAWGESSSQGDKLLYTYDAPAVRDFALSISSRFTLAQEKLGSTLISSFALSGSEAEEALRYARQALTVYNETYGAYPYQHLAVSMIDFPFGGMEYPSLILLQKSLYGSGQGLEWTVAHEAAHQWWYAVVGSDAYYQPWQDEAMAEFSLLDYVGRYYGLDARESMTFERVETAMRVTIPRGVTPGSPVDYYGNMSEYSLVAYRRGAALLVALHTAMGEEFYDFLRTYYKEHAFGLASRQDFEQTLATVSGQDWSGLIVDYLDTYLNN